MGRWAMGGIVVAKTLEKFQTFTSPKATGEGRGEGHDALGHEVGCVYLMQTARSIMRKPLKALVLAVLPVLPLYPGGFV